MEGGRELGGGEGRAREVIRYLIIVPASKIISALRSGGGNKPIPGWSQPASQLTGVPIRACGEAEGNNEIKNANEMYNERKHDY